MSDYCMFEPLVSIQRLHKSFFRDSIEISVLDNINLKIDRGEFVGLMGPSGSGKTTLLNILSAIDTPTSGSVVIDGREISTIREKRLGTWRNRTIGFIFQLYNLIPVLTAYENVELPLLLTNLNGKERREHVETALRLEVDKNR